MPPTSTTKRIKPAAIPAAARKRTAKTAYHHGNLRDEMVLQGMATWNRKGRRP